MTNCKKITRITELLSKARGLCDSLEFDCCGFDYSMRMNQNPQVHISEKLFEKCLTEEKREEHGRTTDKVSATVNGVEVFCLKPWGGRK